MQKRSSITKKHKIVGVDKFRPHVAQGASDAIGEVQTIKNPAAVALGRLGGLKGGKARAEKLSSKRRIAIAKKAAQARWGLKESE